MSNIWVLLEFFELYRLKSLIFKFNDWFIEKMRVKINLGSSNIPFKTKIYKGKKVMIFLPYILCKNASIFFFEKKVIGKV